MYPDGRSILIADYKRRVSLRDGLNAAPARMPPPTDEPVQLDFRVGWLAQCFYAGHSVRITVACTGGPLHETYNVSHGLTATHWLCHGVGQASHVLAPVIVASGVASDVGAADLAQLAAGIFPA